MNDRGEEEAVLAMNEPKERKDENTEVWRGWGKEEEKGGGEKGKREGKGGGCVV